MNGSVILQPFAGTSGENTRKDHWAEVSHFESPANSSSESVPSLGFGGSGLTNSKM